MEDKMKKYKNNIVEGSAVRKAQVVEAPQHEQYEFIRTTITEKTKRHPQVRISQGIDLFSMMILVAAIAATFIICFRYLQIHADIVDLEKKVATLNTQYTKELAENNAMENALDSKAIDLNYVYQVAVGRLGMVFPNHNTVYYYSGDQESFYHQYGEIPE